MVKLACKCKLLVKHPREWPGRALTCRTSFMEVLHGAQVHIRAQLGPWSLVGVWGACRAPAEFLQEVRRCVVGPCKASERPRGWDKEAAEEISARARRPRIQAQGPCLEGPAPASFIKMLNPPRMPSEYIAAIAPLGNLQGRSLYRPQLSP